MYKVRKPTKEREICKKRKKRKETLKYRVDFKKL